MLSSFFICLLFPMTVTADYSKVQNEQKIVPENEVESFYSHSALYLDISDASVLPLYKATDSETSNPQVIVVKR